MESTNRFAPPGAQVEDVALAGGVQPIRLWPPKGRVGRLRFLAYGIGLYIPFFVILLVFGIASRFAPGFENVGLVLGYVVYVAGSVVLLIQRSHDMNLSGWWSIAAFIPLVGLVWLFKGGTPGANRWGAPPPPNSTGVIVVAWFLPVIFILGIVAAVALPAYRDYTVRAHAAGRP